MRAIGIAVLVSLWVATAAAQPAAQDAQRERAHALFLEGRDLLTSNATKAACAKFEASIAIDPRAPGVILNLGLCYELLEMYATSLYWFRRAQSAAAEAKLSAYEDEAKRHTIDLAANKVSTVTIDASAAPPETEIRIDGKRIAPTDYARVEVDRGTHELEASAAGKQVHRQSFDVDRRDAGTLAIPALHDERRAATPGSDRKLFAAGFGGVGLVLCIASPIWASQIKSGYNDAVANGESANWAAARNKQHIATGMFVGGLALIGFGTYLYLTAASREPGAAGVVFAPAAGANQLGFVVGGSM